MDIFFQDPSEIPLPPSEVRIRELSAEPWRDNQRVRIYLEVDPFQQRPNADVTITNPQDEEVTNVSIIESISRKMEFTMHLRSGNPAGQYTVTAVLFYTERVEEDEQSGDKEPPPSKSKVVDRAETTFEIQLTES